MIKVLATVATSVLSLGLMAGFSAQDPARPDAPPTPRKKAGDPKKEEAAKKADPGPEGDLRRAYNLLQRVKADDRPSDRSDERLRDWVERASGFYRKGIQAMETGDERLAHEYGTAAHDLARAVDHARNASRFDRRDNDLPPPPAGPGPEGGEVEARHELRRAYDRITEIDGTSPDARFYRDAASDLYNAARRDAQAGRIERSRELARAAEALTHVPEHLGHAENAPDEPPAKGERLGPKAKAELHDEGLPPELPPRD